MEQTQTRSAPRRYADTRVCTRLDTADGMLIHALLLRDHHACNVVVCGLCGRGGNAPSGGSSGGRRAFASTRSARELVSSTRWDGIGQVDCKGTTGLLLPSQQKICLELGCFTAPNSNRLRTPIRTSHVGGRHRSPHVVRRRRSLIRINTSRIASKRVLWGLGMRQAEQRPSGRNRVENTDVRPQGLVTTQAQILDV